VLRARNERGAAEFSPYRQFVKSKCSYAPPERDCVAYMMGSPVSRPQSAKGLDLARGEHGPNDGNGCENEETTIELGNTVERPNVVLPENVRRMLRERLSTHSLVVRWLTEHRTPISG
jgi:hypothetical protein